MARKSGYFAQISMRTHSAPPAKVRGRNSMPERLNTSASLDDRRRARDVSTKANQVWRRRLRGARVLRDAAGMWHVCHADGFSVAMFPCVSTAIAWMGCNDMDERKAFHAANPKARRYTGGQFVSDQFRL